MREVLKWICHHLQSAGPRVIHRRTPDVMPVLIFSDGACEDSGTSFGTVLFDSDGTVECFGAIVAQTTVDSWKTKADQKQVIGQAELVPLLIARLTWAERIRSKRVLYFVDNESARLAMVKAYSPVLASLDIILRCHHLDAELVAQSWYARVPTHSNIADAPSRMLLSAELKSLGAKVVSPVCPSVVQVQRQLE